MTKDTRQRLIDLGAEMLADTLLDLVSMDERISTIVKDLTEPPRADPQQIKRKLAALQKSTDVIRCVDSFDFSRELTVLLNEIEEAVSEPRTGVELLLTFFRTDDVVFERSDDSSGCLGMLYQDEATELFIRYAKRCKDKDWILQEVLNLNSEDNYGVRTELLDCAALYLPKAKVRELIARLRVFADAEVEMPKRRRWLFRIEELAKALKDGPLFEATRRESWGKLGTAARLDIAHVYYESGDVASARTWLESIETDGHFRDAERDDLLMKIYRDFGETDKLHEVAWREFRRYRSLGALGKLLGIIGEERREAVVREEIGLIHAATTLSLADAMYLIEIGHARDAARYLIQRASQLRGRFYSPLLDIVKHLETARQNLAATVLYRALLDSILDTARTSTYIYGARYLRKLDVLATSISDWEHQPDHAEYHRWLRATHGKKRSFWRQYE